MALFDTLLGSAKAIGGQALFNEVKPLVKDALRSVPALAVDTPLERILWMLEPAALEAILKKVPDGPWKDMVRDGMKEVNQELTSAGKEGTGHAKGSGTHEPKQEVIVFPTIWTSIEKPEIGLVDGCSAKHQNEMKPVTKKRKGAPDEQGEEPVLRDGFSQIEFADFVDGGGRAPATPAEGWKIGCCCKRRIAEARATLQAIRDAKAKAEAPKPKTESLITHDDFRAGAKAVGGAFAGIGRDIRTAAVATGRGFQAVAAKGEAIAKQLPSQARALDGRVAGHAQRVGVEQARLREIGVFARANGVRDVAGFKQAVLAADAAKGTVKLSTLNIAALQRRFGRKDR